MALLFESKVCGRCGGSGSYSWNSRDGSVCFGCNGRKEVLTKRGAAAQAFYTASLTVTMNELAEGDVIAMNGITMGGGCYTTTTKVVSIGELHQYGSSLRDGVWVPSMGRTLETVGLKNGEAHRLTTSDDATFRKTFAPEIMAEKKAAALAYQSTLTATGSTSKRKVAA